MVENEPFMYNKLVAGRDAKVKSGQILTFEPLAGAMEDAVRALEQQMNEFTDFDNQEDVPDQMRTPWNFPCLTWNQRVPRYGQSCAEK